MLRQTIITFLLTPALAFIIAGCGRATPNDSIDTATTAIAAGDYMLAGDIIANAAESIDTSNASVAELCNLALLTMKVNDVAPDEADVNTALDFFTRAAKINRDSVDEYILTLPLDDAIYMQTLRNLERASLIDPASIEEHEMPEDEIGAINEIYTD